MLILGETSSWSGVWILWLHACFIGGVMRVMQPVALVSECVVSTLWLRRIGMWLIYKGSVVLSPFMSVA